MRRTLTNLAHRLRLPAVCALCKQYHNHAMAVCKRCTDDLPRAMQACHGCARPLPNAPTILCGHCLKQPPAFDSMLATCSYEEPLRSLLHEFKYRNGLYLRAWLVDLMLEAWPASSLQPDCLVAVPMHPKRLRQRGFNQAAELARLLGKRLSLTVDLSLCHKRRNTSPQAGLEANERHRNLRDAFAIRKHNYQHVILIDDLATTGSTANELAQALKQSGVLRVDVWCLARTPPGT